MNILSTIQGTIGEELSLLNRTLVEKLHTSNELMNRIIDRYLLTKGKQIRPILIMLCARMIDDITPTTILSAAAIELMHNASLIHDDVIDTSLYRRGEPTINAAEDNRMAILMGDHFVSCALQCGVETGKMDQIDNARSHRLSEDAYFSVIRRKTASLFRACMHVGALSVDADERTRLQLETFGELLGLCFQIKDDIFDYYEEYAVGKPTGNDLREGKVTLPLLYAITHHDGAENKRMRQLLEKEQLDAAEIGALIEYAKANGGIEYAYQRMQELRDEAVRTLEGFPHNDTYHALVSILDYTIARDK